ncbi:MAG: hypothetical protein HUU32_01065 [Calditrichaceae bacterium]|nr:hypothetical protein [Calditrichaceae bacterium]
MNVIGHHHKFIQIHIVEMLGDFLPILAGHFPDFRQLHFPAHNFPKPTFPVAGANGNEIPAGCRIIISLQTGGFDAVAVSEPVGHDEYP